MIQVIILFKEIFKGVDNERKNFYYMTDEKNNELHTWVPNPVRKFF